MTLIKDAKVVTDDPWRQIGDGDDLPDSCPVIVSLERWRKNGLRLAGRNAALGISLKSDQPPEIISGDLDRFGLIALEFPAFTDGRAFSHARLLRQRYGFAGEIRAVGNVLRDQIFFMARCGFDAFELEAGRDPEGAIEALEEFSVVYQAAADGRLPAHRLRAAKF